jgi:hypothetical protein
MAVALIWLVCGRVRLVERQILGLLARFRAGRLWVRVGRSGGRHGNRRVAGTQHLAGRFGWLLPMVPCAAAGFGSQLRHLLDEPEMRALLAQSKRARLVLAPLCRMLGIEAAVLTPGGAAEVVAPIEAKIVAKRVRKVRAEVDWGRIPLPRGVLAAAKRQGFGKV